MAATISVPYTLLMDGGIQEGFPVDGPFAVVKFKVLTSQRYQLIQDLLGTTVKAGNQITRTYPFAYPPSQNLIARAIESVEFRGPGFPLAGGAAWVTRKWSIVTCRFEVAKFFDNTNDPSGKPYSTTTFDGAAEILTLPNGVYKFGSGVPTETPIGLTLPQLTISIKRFMLPYPPISEVAGLLGKVNNAVVTIGNFQFAAGFLLFASGPVTIQADTVGNLMYEAEYKCIYRPYPWNFALNPNGTSGFQAIVDGNGNGPFQSGDFSVLP